MRRNATITAANTAVFISLLLEMKITMRLIKNPEAPHAAPSDIELNNSIIGNFPIVPPISTTNETDRKSAVKNGIEYMQNTTPQITPSAFNKADLSKSKNL